MLDTVVRIHDLRPRDVGEFFALDPEFLRLITSNREIAVDQFLFFDIETTGLSRGPDNMIYLAGFGSIEDERFEVRQYLISDPIKEKDLIRKVIDEFHRKGLVITYNGKAFDLPVVEGRFRFYGYRYDFEFDHLDLLHIARKLLPMEGFSLKRLETDRLGLYRQNDLPSGAIPGMFLRYLMEHDDHYSEQILKHNEYDLLSMAYLLLEMNTAFIEQSDPRVVYRIGRLYERVKDYERARDYYELVMSQGIDYELELLVMKRLAQLYKRQGELDKAVELCQALLSYNDPYPYLEMARHFERAKDYQSAIDLTLQAIDRFPKLKKKLEARLERLKRRYEQR
ncbi:MAG TPA: tetratricopeptide repeat protein [bacterium (Candidatus Stahlbacteria)]|nr:tetratricopeptide repeat protein [Candidatus Stahlbacteria bacterium]